MVNSAPVATPNTASVTEDLTLSASGNVITDVAADSDANLDPITVSAVNGVSGNVGNAIAGTYGTLTLNANGSYSYVLNNAGAAVQGLGATEISYRHFHLHGFGRPRRRGKRGLDLDADRNGARRQRSGG